MLGDDYLDGLSDKTTDDLRSMRDSCVAVETSVSYLRRLVQGRLDIVENELERREHGGDPPDATALIAQLPDILSDRGRPPGRGRLPQTLDPPEPDAELVERLEALGSPLELAALPDASVERLGALREGLTGLEHEISDRRRGLFAAIDALQAELARRYQTGEESIESLLS
jgi:hypothetical protein